MTPGMASNGRGLFTPSLDFGEYGGSVSFWAMIFTINDFDRILIKTRSNMSPTFQLSFHNTNTGANETASSGEQFALWRYRLRANVTDPSGTSSRDFIFNSASAAPFRGVWHHVALHLGPTSAKLYINGGVPQRFFHSQPITYNPDTSLPFVLGNNPSGLGDRKLVGRIDELRFFRNDQPDQELSQPFIMSSLIVDPGTPAPTPMGAPPTPATTPAATTTTTPTTTTTTIAPTTSTTTSTAPPNTTPTPRPTTTTTTITTRLGPSPILVPTPPASTTRNAPESSANDSIARTLSTDSVQATEMIVGDIAQSTSTTDPTTQQGQSPDRDQGAPSGALIGGIVGGVIGLFCIVGAIVAAVVIGRRRQGSSDALDNGSVNVPAATESHYDRIVSSHYSNTITNQSMSSHYDALNSTEI
jgi:hypothetical protein